MLIRLTPRETPAAAWALRLAMLPIPMLVIAVLLHRGGMIDLQPLVVVVGLAWLLSILALVAAGLAFRSIWDRGDRGAAKAAGGTVLALIVLAVPAIILVELVRLPRIADVSTDLIDPPLFTAAPDRVVMRPLPNEAEQMAQLDAYPDIRPRHYALPPDRVYQSAAFLVAERGWAVTDRRAPDADNEVGWIEASAGSTLLALPADVVVRVLADDSGTLVDMRSASRIGAHDLGDDARRIRAFYADLDAALQGIVDADDDSRPMPDDGLAGPLPPLPAPAPLSRR